ncbi:YjgF family translation initiation inhibitor [Agrobacterium sp. ATCC 31749]|nr:YjgF family translation initiation inhibitor [Agrobacterium sp. ATCC 31749]
MFELPQNIQCAETCCGLTVLDGQIVANGALIEQLAVLPGALPCDEDERASSDIGQIIALGRIDLGNLNSEA